MLISDFFKQDFTSYAMYDSYRSIASCIDGLKNSARKIVYTVDKNNIKQPIKVASLASKTVDYCLHPDTEIFINRELIKVSDLEGRKFDIQSYNENTKKMEDDFCIDVFKTKCSSEFIEIITENDSIIKLTPDHRVLTNNGWKEAQFLTEQDELISLIELNS